MSTNTTQIPIFIILIIAYKIRKHGLNVSEWRLERSNDLRFVQIVDPSHRKGKLEFPDQECFFTRKNLRFLGEWLWVWIK